MCGMVEHPHHVKSPHSHRIEIKLHDINQLFNTMDPSPFHEKDLDADAEEFIVSWAQEFPLRDPLAMTIHVSQHDAAQQSDLLIEQAVQHYFLYRADLARLEFRRLLRDGRLSLLIGLVFLTVCLAAAQLISKNSPWIRCVRWVAKACGDSGMGGNVAATSNFTIFMTGGRCAGAGRSSRKWGE